jgi:uncharacterized membrane protein YbaN (DUF454 family)
MTSVSFDRGCLAVQDPRVINESRSRLASFLAYELALLHDVVSADFDLVRGSCIVRWADCQTAASRAAETFIQALAAARAAEQAASQAVIMQGPKRLLFLVAGGGCLAMTVVGAIVPGVPTVPFLLASSYYLARSSRRLHAALTATPVFGGIVREWEAHQAISRGSKAKLAGLTIVVVLTTLAITQVGPVVIVVVTLVVTTTTVGIIRMPEIGRVSGRRRLASRLPAENLIDLVSGGS